MPPVSPNRLNPSRISAPEPELSGTPSTTPANPSATPSHCHQPNRSPSSTTPSAAVSTGWNACTKAVGVAATVTSAACVVESASPCARAPPTRRCGQVRAIGAHGRRSTRTKMIAAAAAIISRMATKA